MFNNNARLVILFLALGLWDVGIFLFALLLYTAYHGMLFVQDGLNSGHNAKSETISSKIRKRLHELKTIEEVNEREMYAEARRNVYKRYLQRASKRVADLDAVQD